MTYAKYNVRDRAIDVFGTEQRADDWMTQMSATLDGPPAKVAETPEGAERVMFHLANIERDSSRDF